MTEKNQFPLPQSPDDTIHALQQKLAHAARQVETGQVRTAEDVKASLRRHIERAGR